jgi:hypothetical protein
MDLHKPKPWHGLREFLKEYLIIVVGVLTALAAEQAVEWVRAQEAVGALRDGIRTELIRNRNRWEANRAQDACVTQRLDAILAWAADGPPGALVAVGPIPSRGMIPRAWNLHASAWDAAKANPVSTHLPIAEHTLYAELYDGLAGQQRDLLDEHSGWVQIASLLAEGDSAEDKRALRKLVIVEKDALVRRQFNYAAMFKRFDALHISSQPLTPDDRAAATALCAPLVTAPPRHGRRG